MPPISAMYPLQSLISKWHPVLKGKLAPAFLKGHCYEVFCFWFFSIISFSQAPDYTNRAVSNFFEKLKVHHWCRWHRWQMEKIFNQKIFHYFFWTPLPSSNCSHCLPPASLTPVANLPPVSLTTVANLPPVSTTLAKLVEKFATGVVDTVVAPWFANISANFRKNSKRS